MQQTALIILTLCILADFSIQKRHKCNWPQKEGYDKAFCYTYHNESLPYVSALQKCAQAGGQLMKVENERHHKHILRSLKRDWDQVSDTLNIWTVPRPLPVHLRNDKCLLQERAYSPKEVDCYQEKHAFFCQYEQADLCNKAQGWEYFDGNCYKVIIGAPGKLLGDMVTSRNICLKEESDLVSVHSYEENEFLKVLVMNASETAFKTKVWSIGSGSWYSLWIGFQLNYTSTSKQERATSFGFMDGTNASFVPTDWKGGNYPWAAEEPNNDRTGFNECCTELHLGPKGDCDQLKPKLCGRWNDLDCQLQRSGAICKKSASKRRNATCKHRYF